MLKAKFLEPALYGFPQRPLVQGSDSCPSGGPSPKAFQTLPSAQNSSVPKLMNKANRHGASYNRLRFQDSRLPGSVRNTQKGERHWL